MKIRTYATLLLASALVAGGTASTQAQAARSARPAAAAPVRWEIDQSHSELTFRIRHLVSRVRGQFNTWKGTVVADPANLTGGSVEVEIQTASIDTNNERRDNHLRTGDFFDAPTHPIITFRSTRVETQGRDLKVHGNLTMGGVTRPVTLEGRMTEVTGAPGKRRMGFEASTTINRLDYGVAWNRAAEAGGVVLGDEVEIEITIAAVERPAT